MPSTKANALVASLLLHSLLGLAYWKAGYDPTSPASMRTRPVTGIALILVVEEAADDAKAEKITKAEEAPTQRILPPNPTPRPNLPVSELRPRTEPAMDTPLLSN